MGCSTGLFKIRLRNPCIFRNKNMTMLFIWGECFHFLVAPCPAVVPVPVPPPELAASDVPRILLLCEERGGTCRKKPLEARRDPR